MALPGSHCISAAPPPSMGLFGIYIPLRGQSQAPDSSSPPKCKIRAVKSVLHGMSAGKENLRGDSDLLPGWVHMAVTDIRDRLQVFVVLICWTLEDFGCFPTQISERSEQKLRKILNLQPHVSPPPQSHCAPHFAAPFPFTYCILSRVVQSSRSPNSFNQPLLHI